ncbi:hypothetical protein L9H26_19020 [Morganella psychrotolerans]|uniref:Uncharacterized protein n=1 Tax=Morganella psychrotolerans TaxID=368603 RepID=A0A5M9QWB5_9GAMM|nr:hypothetical protein [Morganella psychrotolerans]KAA8712994.1 hypothetical protein F4V73_17920 [Morganella psychrotolerans]OBU01905.1 hypothetical protein AYY16_16990 [Morganella psychrotolerans]
MSAEFTKADFVKSVLAMVDLHNLSVMYPFVEAGHDLETKSESDVSIAIALKSCFQDFIDTDKSGSHVLTADDWHSEKAALTKLIGSETTEKVDTWLSMKMLEGSTDLQIAFSRINTVLDGESDYTVAVYDHAAIMDLKGEWESNRKLFLCKIRHSDFNALFNLNTSFHAAMQKVAQTFTGRLSLLDSEEASSEIRKCCHVDPTNRYSISEKGMKFKLRIDATFPEINRDYSTAALASGGFSASSSDLTVQKAEKRVVKQEQKIKKPEKVVSAAESSEVVINGKSFLMGSF